MARNKTERLTYSMDEVAGLLGVSRASAYKAAGEGQIPAIRIGKRIVVPRIAFEAMLQAAKAAEPVQAG